MELPNYKSGRGDSIDRVQGKVTPNVPLRQEDWFELNAMKTQEIQENESPPPQLLKFILEMGPVPG